ncbi:MAG: VCBS repeat-containing protein [candidate division Zixibacteria bacterium]|nr:VCBS repeat-containing protein [candidate division Zixibacteria bacterium]
MQAPKFWLWLLTVVLVAAPAQGQPLTEVNVGLTQSHAGQGASWGDYDGDGDLDLYKVNDGADVLYENQSGTFVDVTAVSGISGTTIGQAAVWGDYDNDGDLDLYVVNYGSANFLYRNRGDKTFEEVGTWAAVNDSGNGASAAWIDYNKDGLLDLYVVNDNQFSWSNKF